MAEGEGAGRFVTLATPKNAVIDKGSVTRYIYATAMKPSDPDSVQAMQRVRVGMTGLASVLVLIGLASAIYSSANREEPVAAIGAARAEVVANMTGAEPANEAANKDASEPLAELGVAPGATATEPANTAAPQR